MTNDRLDAGPQRVLARRYKGRRTPEWRMDATCFAARYCSAPLLITAFFYAVAQYAVDRLSPLRRGGRHWLLFALLCCAVNYSCAAAPPSKDALTPSSHRLTDSAVSHDMAAFDIWEVRLQDMPTHRDSVSRYHRAKAYAWLFLAREEYTDNDRTGITEAAFTQATTLIEEYQSGMVKLEAASVVDGSRRVREDLWEIAEALKRAPGFRCSAGTVAELEVRLVWAGNEDLTCGVNDPRPHLEAAEDLAARAGAQSAGCPRVVSIAMPLTLRYRATFDADTLEIPVLFVEGSTTVTLEGVTFELGSATLTGDARAILNGVALALNEHTDISVEISGHTDDTGARAVNMRLSEERAEAVREYLVGRGVLGNRLVARGYGPDRPAADNSTADGRAENRRVELAIIDNVGAEDPAGTRR